MTDSKKDYLFNIRLSRQTYDKLKSKAMENRESVSNLARKMLNDGLEILDDISEELFDGKFRKKDEIVYYCEGIILTETSCHECGEKLKTNEKIKIGETKKGKKHYFCLNSCES